MHEDAYDNLPVQREVERLQNYCSTHNPPYIFSVSKYGPAKIQIGKDRIPNMLQSAYYFYSTPDVDDLRSLVQYSHTPTLCSAGYIVVEDSTCELSCGNFNECDNCPHFPSSTNSHICNQCEFLDDCDYVGTICEHWWNPEFPDINQ